MQIDFVTLFPEICSGALDFSITGRAQRTGQLKCRFVNLRDFAHDARRTVDDVPYGGGAGMVLMPEPLFECLEAINPGPEKGHVVLMCPQGKRFVQQDAVRLSSYSHLIFVCGHYEGVDERVRQMLADEELSIGDYVLTNGAIAAAVVADAVIRLLPGVLGCDGSSDEESFSDTALLEYPQYTHPEEFRGMCVPQVLLSGDHGRIEEWRKEQRAIRSIARRPDIFEGQEQ